MSNPIEEQVTEATILSPEEKQAILDKYTSPAEEQAKSRNWVPEELYEGPAGNYSSAEVYNVRGEFIGKDRERMREISDLKNQMTTLTKLYKTAQEHGKDQAIAELRKQKAVAINEADGNKVTEIEAQMEDLNKESNVDKLLEQETAQTTQPPPVSAHFKDVWLPSNPWYGTNVELTSLANTIGVGFRNQNPAAGESDMLAYVDKVMQAHLTGISPPATAVTTTPRRTQNPPSGKSKKVTANDLSYIERKAGENFVRSGIFKSLDEYAERLAKS